MVTAVLRDLFGPGTWGTGGNLIASALLFTLGVLGAWLGRHTIGRALAAWWDRHHGPKAVERHKQALREHEASKREDGSDDR